MNASIGIEPKSGPNGSCTSRCNAPAWSSAANVPSRSFSPDPSGSVPSFGYDFGPLPIAAKRWTIFTPPTACS